MENKDLVAVLVTSYNHEKYLPETIESIINQTYENIKLIIVDDNSQDNSRELIKNYKKQYPDKIDYIFNEINMHVNRSFNRGIDYIKEKYNPKYLATCASDDVFELDKIEKQMVFLQNYNYLDAVASAGRYIDTDSKLLENIPLAEVFDKDLYRKEDCERYKENTFKFGFAGPLMQSILFKFHTISDVKFSVDSISDDYCFFIRYFVKGYSIGFIKQNLWRYRIHAKNSHKTMDYTYVVVDVIQRFVPKKYKNIALFNHFFMTGVYQFFYHKNRAQGIRYFVFTMTYLNIDSLKYFSKKLTKGIKWIIKNR